MFERFNVGYVMNINVRCYYYIYGNKIWSVDYSVGYGVQGNIFSSF